MDIEYSSLCDSSFTQAELNDCTYKELLLLHSIMNTKLDCIINYLDDQKNESKAISDSTMESYYVNMEILINTSQDEWFELMSTNASFYIQFYQYGSMAPFAKNTSAIKDVLDRISRLNDFIEILSQGLENRICE
jgi:uncharacterized protein YecT (DUF1311 family)